MNFSPARPARAIEIIIFHRGVRSSKHPSDGMKIQELSVRIITVVFAARAGGRPSAALLRPQFYQDIKNDRFAAVRSQTAIKLSIKVIYRVIADPVFIYTPAIAIFCQWSSTQKARRGNKTEERKTGRNRKKSRGGGKKRSVFNVFHFSFLFSSLLLFSFA